MLNCVSLTLGWIHPPGVWSQHCLQMEPKRLPYCQDRAGSEEEEFCSHLGDQVRLVSQREEDRLHGPWSGLYFPWEDVRIAEEQHWPSVDWTWPDVCLPRPDLPSHQTRVRSCHARLLWPGNFLRGRLRPLLQVWLQVWNNWFCSSGAPFLNQHLHFRSLPAEISQRVVGITNQYNVSAQNANFMAISLHRADKEKFELDFHDLEREILYNRGCVKKVIKLMKYLRDQKGGPMLKLWSHLIKVGSTIDLIN